MKILVTGGGGFLGQALCRGLVARGHEVTSFNRGHYPALRTRRAPGRGRSCRCATQDDGIRRWRRRVFHNAAKAGAWGSYDSYHEANVVGTQNVLDACRAHGIGGWSTPPPPA
jgi:nucleoside-diphosphate-sugar epimerase